MASLQCTNPCSVKEEPKIKAEVSRWVKDPTLIDDSRLCSEVKACIECDDNYSPAIDKIRRYPTTHCCFLYLKNINRDTGEKYEKTLYDVLQSINVPFMNENDMRASGYPKTPDVKLLIPFGALYHKLYLFTVKQQ